MTANHIAQWNITTSAWSALGSGVDTEVLALAIDSSGNLLLGGRFNTVGTTTVSPFITEAVLVGPYIAVQEPAGTTLMEASSIAFGNVTGNSSATLTFTISDPGPATLTSLAVSEDGANAGDFTVSALGSTTVTAGSSTTFTVTFTPGALGARSAAIHIASNVTGIRNPFDVALTGIGVCSTITVINPVSGP